MQQCSPTQTNLGFSLEMTGHRKCHDSVKNQQPNYHSKISSSFGADLCLGSDGENSTCVEATRADSSVKING